MKTSQKIRQIRLLRELTQKQLSVLTGINVRLIQQYESGDRSPKEENLLKLANALQVRPKSLLEPNFASYEDVMFSLFDLENEYGEIDLKPMNGKISISIANPSLNDFLMRWMNAKETLDSEDYIEWKLNYPLNALNRKK